MDDNRDIIRNDPYSQLVSDREFKESFPIRIALKNSSISNHDEQFFGAGNGNIHSNYEIIIYDFFALKNKNSGNHTSCVQTRNPNLS